MHKKKKTILIITAFMFFIALLLNINATQTYLNESDQWQSNLTTVQFASLAFGDIDNDGDLDLALSGSGSNNVAKIYINNGSTLTENTTWQDNLTGVNYGSLAFGDIDNDGDLDLALSGCSNGGNGLSTACNDGGYRTFIYLNNGTSLVENSQWGSNLTKSWKGSLAFGDLNNDGDLDLALSGQSSNGKISKIYINNGTSLVENSTWQGNLTAVFESSLAFGDVNNDGYLDLALCGDKGTSNEISKIYINNGTSFNENSTWQDNLLNVDWCSLAFGDYDNDGDLDLTLIGHTTQDNHRIYRNNGTAFIEINREITGDLIGIFAGSLAFGDYDNDGDLDLVATGNEGYTVLYLYNMSSTNFTKSSQDPESHILNLEKGSNVVFSDIDDDNDLDLALAGYLEPIDFQAKIYTSNTSLTTNNTKPSAPNNFFGSTYSDNVLELGWGNGSDTETNISGLYYNLMIGNSTTNHTIVSGVFGGSSNPTAGYFGNMMQRKNITLYVKLEANTNYSWYVQTIDTGLAKSDWSARQTFVTTGDVDKPNVTLQDPSPDNDLHTTNPYFIFNASVIDANMNNVSLYADFNGSMIVNETNSSGITSNYTFTKNLTNLNDGLYQWYIYACDDDSNCQQSGARTFYLDREYPIVSSISPSDSSTSTSASVTFEYNVSDTDIANCSLIIDGSVDQTDTSVTENTTESFTKSMSNGDYTWSINCTDYVRYRKI